MCRRRDETLESAEVLKRHILYARQEPLRLKDTVLDNFSLCPNPNWEVVEMLGLRPLGTKARDYKKLLTVARVAACRLRMALLDEPTAFLGREKREVVFHLMDLLERRGTLVVWTTHYPPEVEKAEHIYEIRDEAIRRLARVSLPQALCIQGPLDLQM